MILNFVFNIWIYVVWSSQNIRTSLMNEAKGLSGVCHMNSFTVWWQSKDKVGWASLMCDRAGHSKMICISSPREPEWQWRHTLDSLGALENLPLTIGNWIRNSRLQDLQISHTRVSVVMIRGMTCYLENSPSCLSFCQCSLLYCTGIRSKEDWPKLKLQAHEFWICGPSGSKQILLTIMDSISQSVSTRPEIKYQDIAWKCPLPQ